MKLFYPFTPSLACAPYLRAFNVRHIMRINSLVNFIPNGTILILLFYWLHLHIDARARVTARISLYAEKLSTNKIKLYRICIIFRCCCYWLYAVVVVVVAPTKTNVQVTTMPGWLRFDAFSMFGRWSYGFHIIMHPQSTYDNVELETNFMCWIHLLFCWVKCQCNRV